MSQGVTNAVCILEQGAADAHVLGGGKVYELEAVVVSQLEDAETSNRWFICLLLFDLVIRISYDDLHVMFWAADVLPLKLRIKKLLFVIGAPKVRTVHINNAQVE